MAAGEATQKLSAAQKETFAGPGARRPLGLAVFSGRRFTLLFLTMSLLGSSGPGRAAEIVLSLESASSSEIALQWTEPDPASGFQRYELLRGKSSDDASVTSARLALPGLVLLLLAAGLIGAGLRWPAAGTTAGLFALLLVGAGAGAGSKGGSLMPIYTSPEGDLSATGYQDRDVQAGVSYVSTLR